MVINAGIERNISLNDYASFADGELLDRIDKLSVRLRGAAIQHINSTFIGGGVAEILQSLTPIMRSIGLQARWDIISAGEEFFGVTKAFHNAFHGEKIDFSEKMEEIYRLTAAANLDVVDRNADYVIIHDQQPLGLTESKADHRGRWVWYCHIDPVNVDARLWGFLSSYAARCDAAIYHMAEYAKNLGNRQFFLPPAIDPLSDKNREVTAAEQERVLQELDFPHDKPVILQVSRFDRLKNPFGVVDAFRRVRDVIPSYLILAGGAADDDPEGLEVLAQLLKMVDNDPDIRILNLAPTSHLEINVLQRACDIIVQNSTKEGFGLTVTEALWKGKPVVAAPAGGILKQVIHEQTGLLAKDGEELAGCLIRLLKDPGLARELGQRGKEHARQNFITPVYLYNWLSLMNEMRA